LNINVQEQQIIIITQNLLDLSKEVQIPVPALTGDPV